MCARRLVSAGVLAVTTRRAYLRSRVEEVEERWWRQAEAYYNFLQSWNKYERAERNYEGARQLMV